MNRSQSPISTANENAVKVEIPRRHDSRRTTGVNYAAIGQVIPQGAGSYMIRVVLVDVPRGQQLAAFQVKLLFPLVLVVLAYLRIQLAEIVVVEILELA